MNTKLVLVLLYFSVSVLLVSCGKSVPERSVQIENSEDNPSFSKVRSSHSLNGFNISLRGQVKSSNGGSISGAKVRSTLLRCNGDKTGTTSSKGKYSFGLRSGSCDRDRDSVKVCVSATQFNSKRAVSLNLLFGMAQHLY